MRFSGFLAMYRGQASPLVFFFSHTLPLPRMNAGSISTGRGRRRRKNWVLALALVGNRRTEIRVKKIPESQGDKTFQRSFFEISNAPCMDLLIWPSLREPAFLAVRDWSGSQWINLFSVHGVFSL